MLTYPKILSEAPTFPVAPVGVPDLAATGLLENPFLPCSRALLAAPINKDRYIHMNHYKKYI